MTAPAPPQPGTTVLDGLVEGPVPQEAGAVERLETWVASAAARGLRFDLRVDGPAFSLLAGEPAISAGAGGDLPGTVSSALGDLLALVPRGLAGRVFSTLRSTEYRQDCMVQSVYLVTPAGVQVRDRTLPWSPPPAEPPRSMAVLSPWSIGAAACLAAAVIASFFWVDYRGIWRRVVDPYLTIRAEDYAVDAGVYSTYLTIGRKAPDATGQLLDVEVRRSARFPRDVAGYRREDAEASERGDVKTWLGLHRAWIDGRIVIEYLDAQDAVLTTEERSVRGLLERDAVVLGLPVKKVPGVRKIRLGL